MPTYVVVLLGSAGGKPEGKLYRTGVYLGPVSGGDSFWYGPGPTNLHRAAGPHEPEPGWLRAGSDVVVLPAFDGETEETRYLRVAAALRRSGCRSDFRRCGIDRPHIRARYEARPA